jgi:hypothetical protein
MKGWEKWVWLFDGELINLRLGLVSSTISDMPVYSPYLGFVLRQPKAEVVLASKSTMAATSPYPRLIGAAVLGLSKR